MEMRKKEIIEAVEFFKQHFEVLKMRGLVYIDQIPILKKDLGFIVYDFIVINKNFKEKYSSLINNLGNQLHSDAELGFRLEYNENQSHKWHFDNGTHQPNTFGWQTVYEIISDKKAKDFIKFINELNEENNLTYDEIIEHKMLFEGCVEKNGIDVKEIYMIPNIEFMLDYDCKFNCYDIGDNIQIYDCKDDSNRYTIEIISDEKIITQKEKLHNIIGQHNVGFFQLNKYSLDNKHINTWMYRPFAPVNIKP
jgi:hypothetical protein